MKVSIITAVYNAEKYIKDCVESVLLQTYPDIEYIVVDGLSNDNTVRILEGFSDKIHTLISEPDAGMYDALNKGIARATGDVIGILNADDMLAAEDVIENVVRCFEINNQTSGVYGNLNYIDPDHRNKIIRKWISKQFSKKDLEFGWMPAHPTLYLKKSVFEHYGKYSLDFGSAADYEFIVRLLYRHDVKLTFLDKLIVDMRNGGMSNASTRHRWHALVNDYKAMKKNRIPFPLATLLLKKVSKVSQFFH